MSAHFLSPRRGAVSGLILVLAALGRGAAADVTVYDDALAAGWQNWSWNTDVNFSSTAYVYSGSHSMYVSHYGYWDGVYLHATSPAPVSTVEKIRFRIHGGPAGGQKINFCGYRAPGEIAGLVTITLTSDWTLHEIPVGDVGLSGSDVVSGLVWQINMDGPLATYYIDDVVLVSPAGGGDPTPPGAGPALTVDVAQDRRPISEDIYGMSFCDEALAAELRLPVNRWGGNATTRYNYIHDVSNRASDWYFQNIVEPHPNPSELPDNSSADRFVEANNRTGTKSVITLPLIGWTPKSRAKTWSFSIAKYGPQTGNDWQWEPDAGNGISTTSGLPITWNDPHDTCVEIGPDFVKGWIAHLQSRFGAAPTSGSVQLYSLDNEPMLWSSTHRDVRKTPLGYDELRDRTYLYAAAIKEQDPSARTIGPCFWGWDAYRMSDLDRAAGGDWWNTRPDRRAHDDKELSAWYLEQMRIYEETTGVRILDYFDLHYYPAVSGVHSEHLGSASVQAARLQAPRSLWDPTYNDGSWVGEPVYLIPRMKAWIAANYPGTKTCISEYSFGALGYMNGALAQADALGVFGREGLDMAMLWDTPTSSQPGAYAFRMYRNYDGAGSGFGQTSVRATSGDHTKLSLYAAERDDHHLTIMVINKDTSDLATTVTLSNYTPQAAAQVWRYSASNLNAIVREADAAISSGAIPDVTFPAQSITLLVVPSAVTPVSVSRWDVE